MPWALSPRRKSSKNECRPPAQAGAHAQSSVDSRLCGMTRQLRHQKFINSLQMLTTLQQ